MHGQQSIKFNSDTKREWVVSSTPQLPYTQERDPVLLVWEAGWASGWVQKILSLLEFEPRTV